MLNRTNTKKVYEHLRKLFKECWNNCILWLSYCEYSRKYLNRSISSLPISLVSYGIMAIPTLHVVYYGLNFHLLCQFLFPFFRCQCQSFFTLMISFLSSCIIFRGEPYTVPCTLVSSLRTNSK